MQRQLFEHRIDRHSYVIAIGGGAVLDAVGLVAATTHRGIRHIRVPTTVLSQNDSGVGVKNGVNLYEQKNFVGTFAPPFAVLNDIDFIDALPARDRIAGMAEAVKVALIRDAEFFGWIEKSADDLVLFERAAMAYMIRRCAELHMRQIAHGGDPFETGSARPLDFGHWAAHRLETLTHYHLRHGEAVAIGMALDTRYSVLCGLLEPSAERRIRFVLDHLGFRLWHPALGKTMPNGRHAVLEGLREFREHLGGELTITLLAAIGAGVEVHEIDEPLMLKAIACLKEQGAG
jgi:3-dehydroquinate synthase